MVLWLVVVVVVCGVVVDSVGFVVVCGVVAVDVVGSCCCCLCCC